MRAGSTTCSAEWWPSTEHLQTIIVAILASPAVQHTDSTITLSTQIPHRIEPLLQAAAER